jgi:hypothetical protein
MNIGHHHLGSGGYRAAEPKWDKEDDEYRAKGIPNPFSKFENKQLRNFIRARYHVDPKTKELTTETKVKDFEVLAVSNLITADQVDYIIIDQVEFLNGSRYFFCRTRKLLVRDPMVPHPTGRRRPPGGITLLTGR